MENEGVIIVGAGTVGLATALGLARAGIDVHVLEARDSAITEPRDTLYHWSVLEGLSGLGVLGDSERVGLRSDRWGYKVLMTGEIIRFSLSLIADEIPHPFNLHLDQTTMTRIMLAHLTRYPGATVESGAEVTQVTQDASGVTVVAECADGARTCRARWVVGADGSRSIVRRQLGLALAGMTWPERFVSTDLRFDFASLGFAIDGYQIDPVYGAVVSKVNESGLWRYIHAESRTLPEDSIGERVRSILDVVLPAGADPLIESSYPYRIHQRSADRFRVGRALLVGDAAHLTNPTSGLGLTSGLFDAFALTEALAAVIHQERADDILDLYSEVRHRNFWEFTSPTSTEAMELVFPSGDNTRQEEFVQELRELAADPDACRDYLHAGAGSATPSLLSTGPAVLSD
jgi:3-(3-hydroxy-phenyl)propionate hydroxylase/6-hydroxy-3-succinoylpyridine 3-monooxygenase